ncbi:MAG: UDP-N-acetylmuramoyl-L-alanyl-D-glutamate--2,6-diaminopimelate ligase [Propionibacteriaceae bacterium]|nr:UDP-N-acetylmuramoyl-L-alanyl-D-glutamate--2,6-diaminopimelate ligase [Propionibacteriaceae bacterium]
MSQMSEVSASRVVEMLPSISGVTLDSRRVQPGWLYVALPGTTTHGANFIAQAVVAGAIAVLTDVAGAQLAGEVGIPVLTVANPRAVMAAVAAELYGRPADALLMLGVTGTAGKTSTVALLEAGLAAVGRRVGTIGTMGFFFENQKITMQRSTVTTPESPDLQDLLAQLRTMGADAVAMEVSSHAISQARIAEIGFQVAGFTNLGHDHFDYHQDIQGYFQAKAELFTSAYTQCAVVNIADPYGACLAEQIRQANKVRLVTFSSKGDADYTITSLSDTNDGRRRLQLKTPTGVHDFALSLLGDFNVKNALLAAAMFDQVEVSLEAALPGLEKVQIPGRMQRVSLGAGAPNLVVDFAHTPETVTQALSSLPKTRRIAVLGCGGDRDREKRQPMGQVAALNADVVIVTDDNPRSEDPGSIRAQVLTGAQRGAKVSGAQVIECGDRREAIALALDLARLEDWIAILGKGHESGQIVRDEILPFDDVDVATQLWAHGSAAEMGQ